MIFTKKWVSSSANKIDKLITWVIVWTAVASMIWLSQTKKWKKVANSLKDESVKIYKKSYWLFWKCLVSTVNFFKKK